MTRASSGVLVTVSIVAFAGGVVVATVLFKGSGPSIEHFVFHNGDRVIVETSGGKGSRVPRLRIDVPDQPKGTKVEWDGASVGNAPIEFQEDVDDTPHALKLTPPESEPKVREFQAEPQQQVSATFAVGVPNETSDNNAGLTPEQAQALLKTVDDQSQCPTDLVEKVYMEQKTPGAADLVHELEVFRRDGHESLVVATTKPKVEAGQAYLKVGEAVWFYDPTQGKWKRQSDNGEGHAFETDAHVRDFGPSDLAAYYDATYVKTERLGAFVTYKLELVPKSDVDAASPRKAYLWVDRHASNPLKMESLDATKKPAETRYYPKWMEVKGDSAQICRLPKEIHVDDDRSNSQTLILIQEAHLHAQPAELFSKAFVEWKLH